MANYRLSQRADQDLLDIIVYGIEQLGPKQAQTYQQKLSACFETLGENPRMGRKADSIATGVRRHENGSHVILYEPTPDGILILTIIHKRSLRHLSF